MKKTSTRQEWMRQWILLVPLATAAAGSACISLGQDYPDLLPALFFVGALLVTVSMLHQRNLLLENQNLAIRVQEGHQRLDILHQLSVGLNSSLDIKQIAHLVLEHAVRSMDADAGAVWLRPDFDVAGVANSTTGTAARVALDSSQTTAIDDAASRLSPAESAEWKEIEGARGERWHLVTASGWDDEKRSESLKTWHRSLNEGACPAIANNDAGANDAGANGTANVDAMKNGTGAPLQPAAACSAGAHQVGVEGAFDCAVLSAALGAGASMAMAEIRWKNETIGMVSLARWNNLLSRDDLTLLEDIALIAAPSLENSLLYQTAATRADVDGLTELLNHRAVQERLTQEVARAQRAVRDGAPVTLSVALMDLTDFKLFNDTYGHAMGDEVLRVVADCLRDNFRATDTVARYGGDEFLTLLPGTDTTQAERICARLLSSLSARPFIAPDGSRIEIRLSCGIAEFSREHFTAADLFQTADANLYEAKHQGRSMALNPEADAAQTLAPEADTSIEHIATPDATGSANDERALAHSATVLTGDELNRKALRTLDISLSDVLEHVAPSARLWESFGVLNTLISAIDNRDHYTRRQGERVMAFALLLARELEWSREMLQAVQTCGLIHDVGKVAVPDVILRKPGLLSPEEMVLMQQHAAFGAMIVHDVPQRERVLEGVRSHHEAFNGSGYPDGLGGDEIPAMARLIAIPDSFAAMTTDRPYRKSLSPALALQEIERGRGTKFDPEMVDAFLRVMQKIGATPKTDSAPQTAEVAMR